MNTRSSTFGPSIVMQILVAVYLVSLGIISITAYNAPTSELARSLSRLLGTKANAFDLVVAIAEIVAGVIIFLGLFPVVSERLIYFSAIIIALLWVVRIVYYYVAQGLLEPNTVTWLNRISLDLIVATGLWVVASRYR